MLWCRGASAQNVALKTNFAYWAATTPNLGAEFRLKPKMTLDVIVNYNPFELKDDRKLKHWLVQPELRLWTCEAFNRGFFGLHLTGGQYNVAGIDMPWDIFPSLKDSRYDGWMLGAGVSYGWQWYLGRRWNLEATVGVGYLYLKHDVYEKGECGADCGNKTHHYFGPTRIGLSLVYFLKPKNKPKK